FNLAISCVKLAVANANYRISVKDESDHSLITGTSVALKAAAAMLPFTATVQRNQAGVSPATCGQDAPRSARSRPGEQNPDKSDPVKQDRVWTELMRSERRGIREWEKKWSFLRNYDQMGELKTEEPLPSDPSLFSDQVPNTTNQTFGSRLSTPLGNEMLRLDRLLLSTLSGCHHRRKHDPERFYEDDSGAESLHIQASPHNGCCNVDSAKL
ncbi:hypothetical protein INR49_014288, partial [Caranx melampygus]